MASFSTCGKIFGFILVGGAVFSYVLLSLPLGGDNASTIPKDIEILISNHSKVNSSSTSRKVMWEYFYQMEIPPLPGELAKFTRVMDVELFRTTLEILDTFAKTMEQNKLPYFIYGGTLIGSLRHHGPIMWDDDIDVMVDIEDRQKIKEAFANLHPRYTLYSPNPMVPWKFYSQKSVLARANLEWGWPFVDIFFYRRERYKLWDVTWPYNRWEFPTNIVFPLTKRPFANLDLHAPRCSWDFTQRKYDIRQCKSSTWDHRHETWIKTPRVIVDCTQLMRYYPFIIRTSKWSSDIEELKLDGAVLNRTEYEKC